MKLDYKKEYKDLYLPKNKPMLIDVPKMMFFAVDGKGDPNHNMSYQEAIELLYGLSYTIKMSYKNGNEPKGYFEYVVPPLEGLWWIEEGLFDLNKRNNWLWTSMIRQPEFVNEEIFNWACEQLKIKKPALNVDRARFIEFEEGLCVQMMHLGPYSEEPESIEKMRQFMNKNKLVDQTGKIRKHHEIYLSDPRRVKPERLKTVLRHPVRGIK